MHTTTRWLAATIVLVIASATARPAAAQLADDRPRHDGVAGINAKTKVASINNENMADTGLAQPTRVADVNEGGRVAGVLIKEGAVEGIAPMVDKVAGIDVGQSNASVDVRPQKVAAIDVAVEISEGINPDPTHNASVNQYTRTASVNHEDLHDSGIARPTPVAGINQYTRTASVSHYRSHDEGINLGGRVAAVATEVSTTARVDVRYQKVAGVSTYRSRDHAIDRGYTRTIRNRY